MASNACTIAAAITIALASLGTLLFRVMGFSLSIRQGTYLIGENIFVGYAVMVWFNVIALAFGWSSAAYAYQRKHFGVVLLGSFFPIISCFLEATVLSYTPSYVPSALPLIASWGWAIGIQLFLSIAGLIFTWVSREQFTH
jgi:hypothetical protein